jgi:hypothetical protein
MPINFHYDPDVGILFTSVEGLLTFDEILRHLNEEGNAKGIVHAEIFDATQAHTDLTAEQVRVVVQRMIEMARQSVFGPTAVITNNDVVFGMASMLAILSELGGGPNVQAFRTFSEGLDFWRFDRFARSIEQLVLALAEFRTLGIDFVSSQEALDTSTPMGKAMFTIIGAMAELERNVIRERIAGRYGTREAARHQERGSSRQTTGGVRPCPSG